MPPRPPALVLVVDDDVTTNQLIQHIMRQAGFETRSAYDVAGACAVVDERAPDLTLLDVGLPDGSGLDVCQAMVQHPTTAETPVLLISADDDVATKVRGFDAGAVDYITKPIQRAELLARVRTHLRLREAREKLINLEAERLRRLGDVQEALMPRPEDVPDAHFAVSIQQRAVAGGDFYDVVPLGGRAVDYLVADVSGHDESTALWTSALKTLVTEYATATTPPRDVVIALNRVLARVLPPGLYFTAIYARLNRDAQRLTLVSAGHPEPVIVRRGEPAAAVIELEGDVVGAFADAGFGVREEVVRPGDRFYLYSDGLIEVDGDRATGLARLVAACERVRDLPLADAVAAIRAACGGAGAQADDVVLVGVEV